MRMLLLFTLFVFSSVSVADIDVYPFESVEQEERFRALIHEFRCPKCQNQNLSDSNAPLAKDLRGLIHEQIQAGKSDAEIAEYLQERYGDFVLYNPPVKSSTFFLWFGPALVLFTVLFLIFRGKSKLALAEKSGELSAEEKAKLEQILMTDSSNKDKPSL